MRFHSALEAGTEIPASLADARQSPELITAIYSSPETGQPVDLPLANDHPNYSSWTPAQGRQAHARLPGTFPSHKSRRGLHDQEEVRVNFRPVAATLGEFARN